MHFRHLQVIWQQLQDHIGNNGPASSSAAMSASAAHGQVRVGKPGCGNVCEGSQACTNAANLGKMNGDSCSLEEPDSLTQDFRGCLPLEGFYFLVEVKGVMSDDRTP